MEFESYYHIYNKSIDNVILFQCNRDYEHFIKLMEKYISPISKIYVYCLIPNHFHWLAQVRDKESIMKLMEVKLPACRRDANTFIINQFSHFFNAYAKWYNIKYERKGRLFIQSFTRKRIDSNEYLTQIINYIHRNPVHHQLVKSFAQWRYSSYKLLLSNKKTLIEKDLVLDWFGGIENFKIYHETDLNNWREQFSNNLSACEAPESVDCILLN